MLKDAIESQKLVVVLLSDRFSSDAARVLEAWKSERVRDRLKNLISFEYVPGSHGTSGRKPSRESQEEVPELFSRFPGVIAYRNGKVVDQDIPLTSTDEVIVWLDFVASPSADAARKRYEATATDFPKLSHLVLAQRLERLGLTDEAGQLYEWLLEVHLRNPLEFIESHPVEQTAQFDLRHWHTHSRTQREWRTAAISFVKGNASSRERVVALRDEFKGKVESNPSEDKLLRTWLDANEVVPDSSAVAEWFSRLQNDPSKRALVNRYFRAVFSALVQTDDWAAAGRLIDRPLGRMAQTLGSLEAARTLTDGPKPPAALIERAETIASLDLAAHYAALLAAGRDREAQLVAETALCEIDSTVCYRALVAVALKAYQSRPVHREWADIADRDAKPEQQLRAKVDAELDKQHP
ncbi:MAG TPA: hypothetical protein PKE29_01240 [Phycisphaerales bacterium]|nr:hypothetical protein [Phycisphaerales bacterium]